MPKLKTTPVPHSWALEDWPREVFPGSSGRARYLVRKHREELIRAGVLARVGRELIVLGERYAKWLQLHAADVAGYEIPPNTPEARAARTARTAAAPGTEASAA